MPRRLSHRVLEGIVVLSFVAQCVAGPQTVPQAAGAGWVLSWSDEFNGPNGSLPDPSKWAIETGGSGWGNHELEAYTNRPENVHVEDGNLVITSRKESYMGTDIIRREYTSGRIKTAGLFEQKYGRFEARIQIPRGQGMWPAFWLLGNNLGMVHWPSCGEIDVMENVGNAPAEIQGSLNGPGYSGADGISKVYKLPSGKFADAFHVFAVEWEPNVVRFYVDGNLYETKTLADLPKGKAWVYDHPFFILLNVAVGGDWPGSPNDATVFPQHMLVDYVRVYAKK